MHLQSGVPDLGHLLALPPAVTLSLVVSLDGQLCGADGSSRSISGIEDLEWLRRLRASADVVVVGRATAMAEGYRPIRTRDEYRSARTSSGLAEDPHLLVVTRRDHVAAMLPQFGGRVLLEAGVRLHAALSHLIDRVWISHSPTLVGDAHSAFALPLGDFVLAERWAGERFALSRFERSPHADHQGT